MHLATGRYPGGEIRVLFPIDPEAFFPDESTPALGTVLPEAPERTQSD